MTTPARRLVINGPLVGPERSGPAVHLSELVREMLVVRPELQVASRLNSVRRAALNRSSAAAIDTRVVARTTPLPDRWVRAAQHAWGHPSERLLGGRYDIYHQFHTDADPAVDSDRLVVTLHDTVALHWPGEEGAMYSGAGRLLRRAAAVITVSEFSKRAICDAFDVPPERVHVIHNGVRHERFETPQARPRRLTAPYLLYCGGHTPRKNVPRLIAAFAQVRQDPSFADLRLVMAGPVVRAERELRAAMPPALARNAVEFAGFVSDAEMVALYQHADAFVFPSIYEGFGMPVLEAMASGTPVITSGSSALPEVGGRVATYVEAGSTGSIAAAIEQVLGADAESRTARRRAGIEWARAFTWRSAAEQTLRLYDAHTPG